MNTADCKILYKAGLPSNFEEAETGSYIWREIMKDGGVVKASMDIADEGDVFVIQFDRREMDADNVEVARLEFIARYRPGSDVLVPNDEGVEDLEMLVTLFCNSLTRPN